jgi:hypothetical protein
VDAGVAPPGTHALWGQAPPRFTTAAGNQLPSTLGMNGVD